MFTWCTHKYEKSKTKVKYILMSVFTSIILIYHAMTVKERNLLAIGSASPPEVVAVWTSKHAGRRVEAASSGAVQYATRVLLQSTDFFNHFLLTTGAHTSNSHC